MPGSLDPLPIAIETVVGSDTRLPKEVYVAELLDLYPTGMKVEEFSRHRGTLMRLTIDVPRTSQRLVVVIGNEDLHHPEASFTHSLQLQSEQRPPRGASERGPNVAPNKVNDTVIQFARQVAFDLRAALLGLQ